MVFWRITCADSALTDIVGKFVNSDSLHLFNVCKLTIILHESKYKARIHLEQMILAAKSNDPMYHEEVAHLLQHHSA